MKVSTALAAKLFGRSMVATSSDGEHAFKGVLSSVADDAAGQAPTASSTRSKTPDVKTFEANPVDVKMSDLAARSVAAPLSNDNGTARTRDSADRAADLDDQADASADDATETKSDSTATASASASFMALVQIAALVPPVIAATAGAPASMSEGAEPKTTAASTSSAAMPGLSDPSSLLVKAAGDPLVSDVSLETHLAPAEPAKTASKPSASTTSETSSDTIGGVEQTTVATAAKTDAQAGHFDDHAESGADDSKASEPVDQATPNVSAAFEAQPDTSLVIQQKAVLSTPSIAVADAVTSLASQATHATTTASTAPARTMLLQLSPEGLGTVSVRLHLTGHTLDVSLSASNAGTASLLNHDRAALTSALGDRNYHLNSLVIQGGDAASTPGGSSASTDSSGNRSASQSTADQQGGGTDRGGARDPAPRRNGSDLGSASAVAAGDALFV